MANFSRKECGMFRGGIALGEVFTVSLGPNLWCLRNWGGERVPNAALRGISEYVLHLIKQAHGGNLFDASLGQLQKETH